MGFLQELKELLRGDSGPTTASEVSQANPLFVYIKIPGDLDPFDRTERFADRLQEALELAELGRIAGGGSQLSEPDSEGGRSVEFCGIDVDLYHLCKGLELLRKELIRLEAPPGTTLLYELNGQEYEEPVLRNRQ
jgi:hypothetical protein